MKKRKGSLLQRMMAVLLSAVLVTGMAAGEAPAQVFAAGNTEAGQETTGQPETEQGTIDQPETEQGTAAQPETEQETTAQPETEQGTADQPETEQGTAAQPETEQGTIDQPETEQETADQTENAEAQAAEDGVMLTATEDTKEYSVCYTIVGYDENFPFTGEPATIKVKDSTGTIWEGTRAASYLEPDERPDAEKTYEIRITFQLPAGNYQLLINDALKEEFTTSNRLIPYSETYEAVRFYDDDTLINTQYILWDQTVSAPTEPAKDGYTFAGWVTSNGGSTPFDFSQSIANVTDVYASWTETAPTADYEAQYSTDGGNTWKKVATLFDILWNCSDVNSASELRIELLRDITLVGGENWVRYGQQTFGRSNTTWIIDGNGHMMTRGEGVNVQLFVLSQENSKVILQDIIIDGGAVWTGDDPASRTNTGIQLSQGYQQQLIGVGGEGSELVLGNGTILQNNDLGATGYGAGVYLGYNQGKATLTLEEGCEIRNNRASDGGGICIARNDCVVNMKGGSIYGNVACGSSGSGGGMHVNDGTFCMEGGRIYDNVAAANGGGVFNKNTFQMKGGEIYSNHAGTDGGAVRNKNTFQMENGRIYDNYAAANGGAVYNDNTFRMVSGKLDGNSSGNNGGGVFNTGTFQMESGEISGNQSGTGGGIVVYSGTAAITGGSVTGNAVTGRMGGGVLLYDGTLIVSGSPVIQDNTGKDGAVNNVYLKDNTMSVSAPLDAAARIGVTTKTSPTADAPVAVTGTNQADYSGSFFSDNKAYQIENTAGNVIRLAVHVHSYGSDWESDATGHWHGCSCGDKSEEAAHSFGEWTVTKEATESEDGVKERSCSVCQYKETEVIPKKTGGSGEQGGDSGSGEQGGDSGSGEQGGGSGTQAGGSGAQAGAGSTQAGGSGAQAGAGSGSSDGTGAQNPQAPDTGWVEIDEEQGEAAPNTEFGMSKEELAGAVLTPEELSGITAGIVVKIILTVENVDSSVSEADKQTVQALVGDYIVGEYLDIQLFKLIGADRTAILQTNGKIRIVIDVPDSLKAGAGKTRTYAIMRVHDGAAELLSDLDGAEDTITIETDKFSTYVVVYRETNNVGGPDSEPKTGDTDPIRLYATLAMVAGGAYLLLYFEERKGGMTEQKKKEITAAIISWGRKGGRLRKIAAFAAVFAVLFYYHSIGKREDADWKEACVK